MTLSQAIFLVRQELIQARIDDAPVEAELLVRHAGEISKTQLYTELDRTLTQAEANRLQEFIQRRLRHEPTAYILRRCEFYGLDFYVDQRVLIPRPETELMVEKAIESASCYSQTKSITIADVGTGSGVIAISLALALPQARIYAIDMSTASLQVAEINRHKHHVNSQVQLLHGNLLEPLPEPVDMVVANLPYIKDRELEMLSAEIVNFEPIIALAGGEDGLDKIRSLLPQIPGNIYPEACLFMEIGQGQDQAVTSLINSHFPESSVELIPDLGGIDRVVKVNFNRAKVNER